MQNEERLSVVHDPNFFLDEQKQLQEFKNQMDKDYPHDDGSRWSDETTPVKVILAGASTVGLIADDDMVHIPIPPYVFPL